MCICIYFIFLTHQEARSFCASEIATGGLLQAFSRRSCAGGAGIISGRKGPSPSGTSSGDSRGDLHIPAQAAVRETTARWDLVDHAGSSP